MWSQLRTPFLVDVEYCTCVTPSPKSPTLRSRDGIKPKNIVLRSTIPVKSVEFYVRKLVICNHIQFNKVVREKLSTIILNPIN